MKTSIVATALVAVTLRNVLTSAQTFTSCNPLTSGSCPPDSALGRSVNIDFTSGESDSFTPQGNPTYDSNGASFTVAQSGDSPQLTSKWYIMFGHVEFTMKPAPGVGIVSSAVMQSDDLDEIDWEWLGGDANQVQSNYFGKGQTTTYNRGAFHSDPNNQADFKTYTIDWTADQIAWQIDGTTVRTLTPETAEAGQYPQTPMMIKVGAWSGGDPSNPQGTIEWAGGATNYAGGPYTMQVKSIAVTDYSTGTQYTYSGTDGTWQSIKSTGGTINSSGNGASPVGSAAAAVASTSNGAPLPFEGTHRDPSATVVKSGYPWVATTLQTSVSSTATTYPGLPSGWTVTSSGKVLPPSSAAPSPSLPSSTSQDLSPQASGAAGGYEVKTGWDDRGFKTTYTVASSAATQKPQYNEQGFLITPTPALQSRSTPTPAIKVADSASTSAGIMVHGAVTTGGANSNILSPLLGAACLGGVLLLAQEHWKDTTTGDTSSLVVPKAHMATITLFRADILATIVIVGYILLYIYRQIRQHRDIKKLGGYAPKVPTRYPLGLDIVYRFYRAGQLLNEIDIWYWLFSYAPYNKTVEFKIGGQRMVFTADPDNIRAVLAAQFGDYGKGEPFHQDWKEFLGDSIFTTDGQQWSESRNLLRPLFVQTRVRDFEVFERYTDKLMSLIEGRGEEVNLSPSSHQVAWTANALRSYNSFTLDTSTDYLLGASVDSLDNGDNQFATHFNEVQRVQAIMAKVGRTFGFFVPRKYFYEGLNFINDYVNLFIERVSSLNASELVTKEESYTFLHALSRYTSSKTVMRDQLVAVLLAGRDSTAVTLSFIFHELSANPEILAKLRREILEKIGTHKTPSFEDIRNCSYLQKTISETLRLYPPVPYNVRLALRDTSLPRGGGPDGRQPVGIKKDTPIGYSAMILHHNPENYPPVSPEFPDVSVFCPERWNHWTPKAWTYLPFNGGPRVCIGQQFALTEIGYTVVRMLQKYDRIDRYGSDGEMKLKSNIILSPADDIRVGFWEPASAQSTNASAGLSNLVDRDPFIWYPDHTHKIVFERKPSRGREPQEISFYNWNQAAGQAGAEAVAIQSEAHVGLDALIPGNQFKFANRLARHTGGRTWTETRLIEYVFYGRGNTDLRFADVHVLLIGLMHYGKKWARPNHSNLIRMCLLTMYRLQDGVESVFANGSTTLIAGRSPGSVAAS